MNYREYQEKEHILNEKMLDNDYMLKQISSLKSYNDDLNCNDIINDYDSHEIYCALNLMEEKINQYNAELDKKYEDLNREYWGEDEED